MCGKTRRCLSPVGVSAPKNRVTGVTVKGTASWGATEDTALIYTDSSINQFEMNSRGLPGIRELQYLLTSNSNRLMRQVKKIWTELEQLKIKLAISPKPLARLHHRRISNQ